MSIVLKHAGFEWPDGREIFQDLNLSLENRIYALVGPNGAGKTTLARLMSGGLPPSRGLIHRNGDVAYFEQSASRPPIPVAEYLLSEIDEPDEYVLSVLSAWGERDCSSLSGGEWTRVRLAKVIGSKASFVILDEPTNHLDREGRKAVHEFLDRYSGGVLLISHDRELLELAEQILELTDKGLASFGLNWVEYLKAREQERERLSRELEKAKHRRDRTERDRQAKLERQAKRQRQARANAADSGIPRLILGMRKRAAQVTTGKLDQATTREVDSAVSAAWDAFRAVKRDPVMYARLPQAQPSEGKVVLEARDFNFRFRGSQQDLWPRPLSFSFQGPVRVAVRGRNGSGKSTLFRLLAKEVLDGSSTGVLRTGPVNAVFLDQEHRLLDNRTSILENLRLSSRRDESELRGHLAMFLFKGDDVHRSVGTLSGGERLRAALAKALLSDPVPNALFLDEPTNNLDLPNIEFLEELLVHYKGALVVVSHDERFLQRLELTDEIELDSGRRENAK